MNILCKVSKNTYEEHFVLVCSICTQKLKITKISFLIITVLFFFYLCKELSEKNIRLQNLKIFITSKGKL